MKYRLFTMLSILTISCTYIRGIQENPKVYIKKYKGLLGNRLFQFCFGKILSKELNFPLVCPPIYGFPETYLYRGSVYSSFPSQRLTGHVVDLSRICMNKRLRNVLLEGFFIRYEYYKEYTDDIKHWLRFDEKVQPHDNPNDIVVHVRVGNKMAYLPFSYYEEALASTTFDRVYICTNEPGHPFIRKFAKYNPIIKTTTSLNKFFDQKLPYEEIIKLTLGDFKFIMSFSKIVVSQSTFSWWAAFLSDAQEVFAPCPNKGYMSSERPDVQLKVEEERYVYIPCTLDR